MFTSYYLVQKGASVTMVEKNPSETGTSVYNAGYIVPSFAPTPPIGIGKILATYLGVQGPVYIPPGQVLRNAGWLRAALKGIRGSAKASIDLGMKSLELYNAFFAEEKADLDLKKGVLGLYKHAEMAKKDAQALKGQQLDREETLRQGFTGFEAGVLFGEELSVNPLKLFRELRRRLTKVGVKVALGKEAQLRGQRPRISSALIDSENVDADAFVIAAGAWSRELCAPLGYDPQIIPARGLAMTFDTGGANVAGYPGLFEDYGIAVVQHNQNTVTLTSFFELRDFQSTFSESRKKWLLDSVSSHLKDYGKLRYVREGVGFRPSTPDQFPVIGKVPGYENVLIAAGHSRLGVTLAPATGYAIASLLAGETPPDIPLSEFDPSRFTS